MIRTLSVIAAIGLAVTVATAQQNPIAARKQLMKDNGDQAKIGAAMAKGEAPFDLAKAHKIFATFEDAAAKAPALFQDNSAEQATADDPYTASPEIWKNMDDFKSKMRTIVMADDFLKDNYLSAEFRVPVTLTKTNACSPLATNALGGNIWDNFSSHSYKDLPSVGEIT